MKNIINRVIQLPMFVRLSLFIVLSLLITYLASKNFLDLQNAQISENEIRFLQLNNKINQYHRDRKSILLQKQKVNSLKLQLSEFTTRLASFNSNAPERALLDSALKSTIKTQEVKISNQLQDKFGKYFLVNLKVAGKKPNINQFFTMLLKQHELAIWEQLVIERSQDQLNLSVEIRYYFELGNEIQG